MRVSAWFKMILLLLLLPFFSAIGFHEDAYAWGKEGPLLEGISQSEFNRYRASYGYGAFGPGCMPGPYPQPACAMAPSEMGLSVAQASKTYKKARVRRSKGCR